MIIAGQFRMRNGHPSSQNGATRHVGAAPGKRGSDKRATNATNGATHHTGKKATNGATHHTGKKGTPGRRMLGKRCHPSYRVERSTRPAQGLTRDVPCLRAALDITGPLTIPGRTQRSAGAGCTRDVPCLRASPRYLEVAARLACGPSDQSAC